MADRAYASPVSVILDTDPGIDDALAILLGIASPEIKIEGLTIVYGNCALDQAADNALAVLNLANRADIPVYTGCGQPLIQPLRLAADTHGSSGLGYAKLNPPEVRKHSQHAVNFLIERVLSNPGKITLVALGPLTNLALAIRLEPRIIPAFREVIIMGGAINHPGNQTPQAEFNIASDPHAAHIVFHSGAPLTLVPLDVTYQTILAKADVDGLLKFDSPVSRFIDDATRFYINYHSEHQAIDGCAINDPLALALTFMPELVKVQPLYVDVDLSGGVSMGKTYADFYRMLDKPPNMQVAMEVRARDFIELFLERIRPLCEAIQN